MTKPQFDSAKAREILSGALASSGDGIHPTAHSLILDAFPEHFLLETDNGYFRPWHHSDLWKITAAEFDGLETQFSHQWHSKKDESYHNFYSGWLRVVWNDQKLLLLGIGVTEGYCRSIRWYVVAESHTIAEGFFAEVCRFHSTVKGEVLVFQEGQWHPDKDLYASIQGSTLEDLVLHGSLKSEITEDLRVFFDQEETYQKFRIPWKRGVVFLGPPGNGKTHMIKALVNHFKLPCLYVKSFDSQHYSTQQCVSSVFERAREVAPCLLILEDLDTLLNDENRSFFLNEMDGFASNHGIVTIASCNFPEKLDAAILERPSRFDRKYHFELPAVEDRRSYLAAFMGRFDEQLQLDDSELDRIAEISEGYSFAYLKELYVSAVVRWVSTERHRTIVEVLAEQAGSLRGQMMTETSEQMNHPAPRARPRYPYFPRFSMNSDEDED